MTLMAFYSHDPFDVDRSDDRLLLQSCEGNWPFSYRNEQTVLMNENWEIHAKVTSSLNKGDHPFGVRFQVMELSSLSLLSKQSKANTTYDEFELSDINK